MTNKAFFLIFGLFCLASSCFIMQRNGMKNITQPQPEKIQLNDVKITPARQDDFRTTPIRQMDLLHMDLDVRFNMSRHECMGYADLTMKPYFYETDSIILDAKNMVIDGLFIYSQQDTLKHTLTYDQKMIRIKLDQKINVRDTVHVVIRYIARPDGKEKGGSKAISDDKGLYFINTDRSEPYKPVQIWTQGETESNSCWFPTIDKPLEKFTSKLTITTDKNFTILSNGKRLSSNIYNDMKTETWENALPMSAYLIMMAIGEFNITMDSINNKEVSYYLEPDYSPYAREIFRYTKEMVDFFSGKLGVAYPWDKYAQVVVRDYVSGAMENTSATLHGESVQKFPRELVDGNNEAIIAHELFHQWFGDLVTCESWSHLVLNEGFATFGEQLWDEYKHGSDAALRKCNNAMNRYLDFSKNGSDGPIVDYNYRDKEDMFNAITYQKGGRVLNLLRSELGDEAFFLGLKKYLMHHAFNSAEVDDLRLEMESVCGRDLRPFFQQWFMRGGHPDIEVRYNYNDSSKLLGVFVEQKQSAETGLFHFPLKFKVTHGGQTRYYTFQVDRKKESFYVKRLVPDDASLPAVFVDPDATFIGRISDNKSFFQHVQTYREADDYLEKYRSLKALSTLQSQNDTIRQTLLFALDDADADIRLKSIEWLDWKMPDNVLRGKDKLIQMARSDRSAAVRAEACSVLAELKDAQLLSLFMEATNDSSYTVAAEALDGVYKLVPDEGVRMASRLQGDARGRLLAKISEIFSSSGDSSSLRFFHEQMMKVFNQRRSMLIRDYTQLFLRINTEPVIQQGVINLQERAAMDGYPMVRFNSIKNLREVRRHYDTLVVNTKDVELKAQFLGQVQKLDEMVQELIKKEKESSVIGMLKMSGFVVPEN
ncbi:MAG: M1 family metallopeptidase [Chitinophagaceae bacterium]|nr:M1 family metallopeptidase [Chitinophagaceae bacterium]